MPQKARLDVLRLERFLQQWVGLEVDHADGQIVGRSPVGVKQLQFVFCRWCDGWQLLMWCGRHGVAIDVTSMRPTRHGWCTKADLIAGPVRKVAITIRSARQGLHMNVGRSRIGPSHEQSGLLFTSKVGRKFLQRHAVSCPAERDQQP